MAGVTRDLGPCQVLFNGVDLGSTLGGVTFRASEEARPVRSDQTGVTDLDQIKVGSSCSVEANLTRTAVGRLAQIIGGATYTGSAMRVFNNVGFSMVDNAKQLIIKPLVEGVPSTDQKEWLTIPLAFPKTDLEVVYSFENQRVYKATFVGFSDPTTGLLWKIG